MKKAKKVWVILADEAVSSCLVNAVYLNKEKAEEWVKERNDSLRCDWYWIEQSQLIQ